MLVDDNRLTRPPTIRKKQALVAATALLALLMELIHDGSGFLFAGGRARVRRSPPNTEQKPSIVTSLPARAAGQPAAGGGRGCLH